jgi:hypothetical protein
VVHAQLKNLWGSGIGRLPKVEIVKIGLDTLNALSSFLGDEHHYFLNRDAPGDLDIDVFAFIGGLFLVPQESDWSKNVANDPEYRNLNQFAHRMRNVLKL